MKGEKVCQAYDPGFVRESEKNPETPLHPGEHGKTRRETCWKVEIEKPHIASTFIKIWIGEKSVLGAFRQQGYQSVLGKCSCATRAAWSAECGRFLLFVGRSHSHFGDVQCQEGKLYRNLKPGPNHKTDMRGNYSMVRRSDGRTVGLVNDQEVACSAKRVVELTDYCRVRFDDNQRVSWSNGWEFLRWVLGSYF